jgi:hypothetical protein
MQKAPLNAPVKNRFGASFVFAASISLKKAKNSPALEQFRIFAALSGRPLGIRRKFFLRLAVDFHPRKSCNFLGTPG